MGYVNIWRLNADTLGETNIILRRNYISKHFIHLDRYGDSHCGVHTVKPVCNDHLYNKIYYLWFIQ